MKGVIIFINGVCLLFLHCHCTVLMLIMRGIVRMALCFWWSVLFHCALLCICVFCIDVFCIVLRLFVLLLFLVCIATFINIIVYFLVGIGTLIL